MPEYQINKITPHFTVASESPLAALALVSVSKHVDVPSPEHAASVPHMQVLEVQMLVPMLKPQSKAVPQKHLP